jgi:GNAT superfamily N-acetyltransferase
MKARIEVVSDIKRSVRVQQAESIFDVTPGAKSVLSWDVDMPVEGRKWNIGLICGPSGCGKTTVARKFFNDRIIAGYDWPENASILDGFPPGMSIKTITGYLSSVGFSSPPAWLRPFHALSNGEQFRVTMARVLSEDNGIAVVDEFTSVVDRTVAQIGSSAIAKAVRRADKQFIAVTCHMDVEDWLQPDWIYLPAEGKFLWRSVQPRPEISLIFNRCTHHVWPIFKHHHYMSADLNKASYCFVAFWRDIPVGFSAWLPFVGRLRGGQKARRDHRIVVLPDYQGIGLGRELADFPAALWGGLGLRAFSGSSHPAVIATRARSSKWRCTQRPALSGQDTKIKRLAASRATTRMRAAFEYIGPVLEREHAQALLEHRCRQL